MNKKVAGLGACVYDTLIECRKFPEEDKKMKADGVFVSGGGPVGNALIVLSKLGIESKVLGLFANDGAGKYLLEDFKKYGVDTSDTVLLDGKTTFSSYILLSGEKGTRTCVFDRGTVPDDASLINLKALDGADLLHLDGNYLNCALKCAEYCKEKGILVSLDAGGLYDGIEKLLPLVDVLIPSSEFAFGITGKTDIPSAMETLKERYNPKVLVVTDGVNGGYYMENGEFKKYDSFKVKAVDTNGCGDTFHGAFVSAYLKGKSVKDSAVFASAVSAYKCTNFGARTYKLSESIVEEFIKSL